MAMLRARCASAIAILFPCESVSRNEQPNIDRIINRSLIAFYGAFPSPLIPSTWSVRVQAQALNQCRSGGGAKSDRFQLAINYGTNIWGQSSLKFWKFSINPLMPVQWVSSLRVSVCLESPDEAALSDMATLWLNVTPCLVMLEGNRRRLKARGEDRRWLVRTRREIEKYK